MYRKLLFMVMIFSIGVALLPQNQSPVVQAQDDESDSEWEFVFLSNNREILVTVDSTGSMSTLRLPDVGAQIFEVRVSASRRYVAFLDSDYEFHIYDYEDEAFRSAPELPVEYDKMTLRMGDFSPDEQQFVLGFDYEINDADIYGGMMIFDISSRVVQSYVSSYPERKYFNEIYWDTAGIYFQERPFLFLYEPPSVWYDHYWGSDKHDFPATNRLHMYGSDTLKLTGELVYAYSDFNYPHSGDLVPSGYNAKFAGNTIRYFGNAGNWRDRDNQPVQDIYWDSDAHKVSNPIWVMDGTGIVLQISEERALLILRDGSQYEFSASAGDAWGTPDGWLVQRNGTNVLRHYSFDPIAQEIYQDFIIQDFFPPSMWLIEAPPLGNASTGDFATIPPYNWGEPLCEGALPSRVEIGMEAVMRVRNNNSIYQESSTTSLIIGTVEYGDKFYEFEDLPGQFEIIDGPICENGITWWKVFRQINYHHNEDSGRSEYDTYIGWMQEGDEYYYMEPRTTGTMSYDYIVEEYGNDVVYPANAPLSCPGYLNSIQLSAGDLGQVLPGDPNNIRDEPFMDAEFISQIPGEGVFEVIAGPRCSSDVLWWQVDYDGTIGWTGEGIRNIYWVEPYTPDEETLAATVTTCDGFLPSRLSIGTTAKVTAGAANNVRSEARYDAELVGQIPGEASFAILDGPVCGENSAWWQVEYEGITGWTAEGQGDSYWLEP